LAASIRSEGLLQPVVLRKVGDRYELIAGERRWRAFQLLKLKTIPAHINTTAGEASAAVLGLIENLQRADLNPIEEANGYATLVRDFKLTAETAAERVGKPRTTVANSLRLLQLDAELQGYVSRGLLSAGHAKVLLSVPDPARRALLARRAIAEGLSVRATEKIAQYQPSAPAASAPGPKPAPLNNATAATIAAIEKKLTSHLGARTQLRHSPKKGAIIIHYSGNEDLQRILDTLKVQI
ncbi:MAG: ParB/RepB/Spo0J family partition protein, partial [Opitutaceae bacterium]|nr:ParB/RepB/Spo0J family partition protein [Opitutaceae bacterium]